MKTIQTLSLAVFAMFILIGCGSENQEVSTNEEVQMSQEQREYFESQGYTVGNYNDGMATHRASGCTYAGTTVQSGDQMPACPQCAGHIVMTTTFDCGGIKTKIVKLVAER